MAGRINFYSQLLIPTIRIIDISSSYYGWMDQQQLCIIVDIDNSILVLVLVGDGLEKLSFIGVHF